VVEPSLNGEPAQSRPGRASSYLRAHRSLLDNLVRPLQQRRRDREPEGPGPTRRTWDRRLQRALASHRSPV